MFSQSLEILMVEDNCADVLLVREHFKDNDMLGNNLHVVKDGVEALAFLRREGEYSSVPKPDIILLDLNFPRKDGRTVLHEIKNDDLLREIPVVLLATSVHDIDYIRIENPNADWCVDKPVDSLKFISAARSIGLISEKGSN